MSLLTVANLQHAYGTHIVLDGATFAIAEGEKVGLVGRNGSGKTTLMKALLGNVQADSGAIQFRRGARVGYLSQDPSFERGDTVRDAAERAFAELHELHRQANDLYEAMANAEGPELDQVLRRQAQLDAKIETAGGYAVDHRIDAMLHGLGFDDAQFKQDVSTLSGGQKNRLGLARLLLEAPDLLLLDEPTNHLDIAGRQWLEEFLAEDYSGAVLLVSHDRWLLDRVVSRIVEVERGMIREYPGNYHKYLALRRERMLTESRVHEKQLDRIRQEEQFIRRYKTGQRAKQARGRQSRLDRFKRDELVERPLELDVMRLDLPNAPRSGDQVVTAEQISKQYDGKVLFHNFDLSISRGDRLGVIGPNGVGKTTLIKCLLGEVEPDEGSVRLGSRLHIGHYKQTHEHLDRSLTVWQYLQRTINGPGGMNQCSEQQARDVAGAFLFSGMEQDKILADLSGGERSRAVLAGLVASAHNLLVLDEPTNHLDLPSAERLEQALSFEGGYEGTLILISHDRALLDATCDRLIVFEGDGRTRLFPGRFRDWDARVRAELAQTRENTRVAAHSAPKPARPAKVTVPSSADNALAALSMLKLESRIEEIENRIREIDADMAKPQVYSDGGMCKALQLERAALQDELEPIEREWSRRAAAD